MPKTPAGQENQDGTVLSFDNGTHVKKKNGEVAAFGGLRDQSCSMRATPK